jgi:hypothetical protein
VRCPTADGRPRRKQHHDARLRVSDGERLTGAYAVGPKAGEWLGGGAVRSVLRRSRGFDVPDFLAAGRRDVLVRASQLQLARAVLP